MRLKRAGKFAAGIFVSAAFLFCLPAGSCGVTVTPPEAILAGTWDLVPELPLSFDHMEFDVDPSGVVRETRTFSRTLLGAQVTVTERDLNLPAKLTGSDARIILTSDLIFKATLNAAADTLNGKLVTEVNIFNTTITTEVGNATATKQP